MNRRTANFLGLPPCWSGRRTKPTPCPWKNRSASKWTATTSRSCYSANEVIEEETTLGQRIADKVAGFGGSWTFILTFLTVLLVYTAVNIVLGHSAWDPYPFILLNLFLSMLAAIQAPVIMMSQNRQDSKDRVRGELDYDVNRRAEKEIQAVSNKLNLLNEKIA